MEWIGAPSPRSTAWRTPSRSTTTATTLYPLAAQAATESPTSWFASDAEIFGLLIRPCAFAPTAASATAPASTPYFHTDDTRDMASLPLAGRVLTLPARGDDRRSCQGAEAPSLRHVRQLLQRCLELSSPRKRRPGG